MIAVVRAACIGVAASFALSGQVQAGTIQYTGQERFVSVTISDSLFPNPVSTRDRTDAANFNIFDETATLTSDSNSGSASQLSVLGDDSVSGQGTASISAFSGSLSSVSSASRVRVDFTLDSAVVYDLTGLLTGTFTPVGFRNQNNGSGVAHFELTSAANGVLLSSEIGGSLTSSGALDLAHSGALAAGDYTLLAFITAAGTHTTIGPFSSGGGSAAPAFSFAFTTTPVPAPGSFGLLAVALAGLARVAASRKRTPSCG